MDREPVAQIWDKCNDDIRDLMEMVEPRLKAGELDVYRKWKLMLNWVARRGSERCGLKFDEPIHDLIDQRADGALAPNSLEDARQRLDATRSERHQRCARPTPEDHALNAVLTAAYFSPTRDREYDGMYYAYTAVAELFDSPAEELANQTVVFKDIFANPFRSVAFDPTWQTESSVGIAAEMYAIKQFENMPILADALQDAGCENEAILRHCREPGTHVRGCWVVDIVLGKQ